MQKQVNFSDSYRKCHCMTVALLESIIILLILFSGTRFRCSYNSTTAYSFHFHLLFIFFFFFVLLQCLMPKSFPLNFKWTFKIRRFDYIVTAINLFAEESIAHIILYQWMRYIQLISEIKFILITSFYKCFGV